MTPTLFVKANDRPSDEAISVRLYDAFLQSYRESHPEEAIVEVDLFAEPLPYLGSMVLSALSKSAKGLTLTREEQFVHSIVNKHLEQFIAADKVVLAFPLWNLTVPAVLHSYLDYMHRPGKTFSYSDKGATGLLTGKKVALLNARGGVYAEGDRFEMAVNFVRNQLNFFGITDITTCIIEGHDEFPKRREAIIAEGLRQAAEAARTF